MSSLTSEGSTEVTEIQGFWTPQRVQKLQQLWAANLTQKEIGQAFGVSRSTVSGKIRRLKLTRHAHPLPVIKADKARTPKPKPRSAPRKQVTALIITGPVSIIDRSKGQCCAVLEGVKDNRGLAMMCGNRTHEHSPWCKAHHELFYDHERGKLHGKGRNSY